MEAFLKIGKWLTPTICMVFGFLYLNGAASSWWSSWGPPTSSPESWQQRAIYQLGYAVALFVTAPMFFIAFSNKFNLNTSNYKFWWVLIIVVALSYPYIRVFILTDSCLDSGGSWQTTQFRCQHE